jgi:8-oxo-dGTP diphosphatase
MKRDQIVGEFSAGGVVFRKDNNKIRYLLIKDHDNHWTIPKGHIKTGEDPKEAALREIKEETGLNNLNIVRELESTRYFYCRGKDLIRKTVYLYLIAAEGNEELNPDKSEVKGAMWFSGKDALKNVFYANIKDMLNKAMVGGKIESRRLK